jgi:hypothetical protein
MSTTTTGLRLVVSAPSRLLPLALPLPISIDHGYRPKCWRATVDEDGHYSFAVAL